MIADLHTHTTASDGRLTPSGLLQAAEEAGLAYLAITDHDTLDGFLELEAVGVGSRVRVIPGIEFSTDVPGAEVHILGYCIDPHHPELRAQLHILQNDRFTRIDRMVGKLHALGFPVEKERISRFAGKAASIGRPHVAAALVEQGFFPSIGAAFEQVIARGKPAYVPHYKLSPAETIRLIRAAGGVPVLAHPGMVGSEGLVRELISLGLRGLEAYHPKHSPEDIALVEQLAKEYRLLLTGGSDFHGFPGRFPEQLGLFQVDADLAVRLLAVAAGE